MNLLGLPFGPLPQARKVHHLPLAVPQFNSPIHPVGGYPHCNFRPYYDNYSDDYYDYHTAKDEMTKKINAYCIENFLDRECLLNLYFDFIEQVGVLNYRRGSFPTGKRSNRFSQVNQRYWCFFSAKTKSTFINN